MSRWRGTVCDNDAVDITDVLVWGMEAACVGGWCNLKESWQLGVSIQCDAKDIMWGGCTEVPIHH